MMMAEKLALLLCLSKTHLYNPLYIIDHPPPLLPHAGYKKSENLFGKAANKIVDVFLQPRVPPNSYVFLQRQCFHPGTNVHAQTVYTNNWGWALRLCM